MKKEGCAVGRIDEKACAMLCLLTRAALEENDEAQPLTRPQVSRMLACGALSGLVLREVPDVEQQTLDRARALLSRVRAVYDCVRVYEESGYRLMTPEHPAWPRALYALGEHMPLFLFAWGSDALLGAPALSVAGSRKILPETKRAAELTGRQIAREGFDMAVFTFDRDNEPHLCVAQLPYRRGVVHQVENGEEGLTTMLLMHGTVLPLASGKAYAGFVVNLSTGDIRLRDTAVLTNVGNRQLFSEALFAMAPTRSTKEAVQAVTEAIAQAAPEMPEQELRPAVKRAMAASIEEKGVIDVQSVAEEVFRSDPEREAMIEQVSRQLAEESVEPVIPVENKRVVAQLQKVKIRTDNGISISLPRSLADDEGSFAVINNPDGTISIVINHVQELRTE